MDLMNPARSFLSSLSTLAVGRATLRAADSMLARCSSAWLWSSFFLPSTHVPTTRSNSRTGGASPSPSASSISMT